MLVYQRVGSLLRAFCVFDWKEIQEGHWSHACALCQEHFLSDRNMKQAENVGHPCRTEGFLKLGAIPFDPFSPLD